MNRVGGRLRTDHVGPVTIAARRDAPARAVAPAWPVLLAWTGVILVARVVLLDLKQSGDQCYLIEVNDNPNIDAGNEDGILKDALYREIMGYFRRRIDERRGSVSAARMVQESTT